MQTSQSDRYLLLVASTIGTRARAASAAQVLGAGKEPVTSQISHAIFGRWKTRYLGGFPVEYGSRIFTIRFASLLGTGG